MGLLQKSFSVSIYPNIEISLPIFVCDNSFYNKKICQSNEYFALSL